MRTLDCGGRKGHRWVVVDGDVVDVTESEYWSYMDGVDPLNRPGFGDAPRELGAQYRYNK